ncbi:MAG: sarcosine oxidase subunit beta family protein [Alphaproteobacteria bacterium]
MTSYNLWQVIKGGLNGQAHWSKAFENCDQPKASYDAIIIGGGGHGLATAYYLAKNHGMTNIAILERGTIGQGNVGRNTTVVRSNYELHANTNFYELSVKLWESLSHDLNYNVMFSQRGVTNIAHTPGEFDGFRRRGNAMRLNGVDAQLFNVDQLKQRYPMLNYNPHARFPIVGGLHQRRAGTARHDAVAWGFARAAYQRGVDLLQNCPVEGFIIENGKVVGVETPKGQIKAPKIGVAVAGHTSRVMAMAGIERLPIESHLLQACISEGLKPFIDGVVTFGGGGHFYLSQTDKGGLIFGGDLDFYNSYSAKGNLTTIGTVTDIAKALIPNISRVRLLRHWGGVMDMSMDGSPILSKTPIDGLYLNGGWCYGGFKATPASGYCFAHLLATGAPHPKAADFTLERYHQGAVIDERGAGASPKLH